MSSALAAAGPTRVLDRSSGEVFEEQIFGGAALAFGYENPLGRALTSPAWVQRAVSRLVGWYQGTRRSAAAIPGFVARYRIPMDEFAEPPGGFRSFNEFFVRELAPGARTFPDDPSVMGAAAEGRLTVFPVEAPSVPLVIKGRALSVAELVGDDALAARLVGGHAFVYRLCPVDYHRFHFPDAGTPSPPVTLGHALHSVHPIAHRRVPGVFLVNERQRTILAGERFGSTVLVEVGAMCVGRIVQTYRPGERVGVGDEKGYFCFGGSSTIVLTEPRRVAPDADLLDATRSGIEVLVRLGEPVGRAT